MNYLIFDLRIWTCYNHFAVPFHRCYFG